MKIAEIVSTPEAYAKTVFATFLGKPVVGPGDIRDIINQYFKLNAQSDEEAVQQVIDALKDRPRTRMVRQIFNDLQMMVQKMHLKIGAYYYATLNHLSEKHKKQGQTL